MGSSTELYAISDLHVDRPPNREAVAALPARPRDWLIVAGDVSASVPRFAATFQELSRRFSRVLWTPGNHDLWSEPGGSVRGEDKYFALVEVCRELGVLTPEDPYEVWPGDSGVRIAPIFTLYDYSFRPEHIPVEVAVAWAAEEGIQAADERFLQPYPYRSRAEWCRTRVAYTERRLAGIEEKLILAGHFPLRYDLVRLPRIPRFSPWCGTRLTENWHTRFPAHTVIYGHLHIRGTSFRDGVRFEEVSLGYPEGWNQSLGMDAYLKRIL
ncbi:MAG: metallophosphoesterase [Armatimonadetes bacterium]|nr:metallophosphoesterase [Armatimonadota bacterium]